MSKVIGHVIILASILPNVFSRSFVFSIFSFLIGQYKSAGQISLFLLVSTFQ